MKVYIKDNQRKIKTYKNSKDRKEKGKSKRNI